MKTHILDVTTNNDVPFRLKLTVDDTPGLTKITFYDRRGEGTEHGDIVCVRYAKDVVDHPHWAGIQPVFPGYPNAMEMYIDGPTTYHIADWLNRQLDQGIWFAE